ncbi:hypothetical protein, partial [Rhizobium paknamense]|uniref:hypothetical protein n=1 Tax=Rhizobium paknamense TaxID=1206817 RepID=UPI0035ED9794
DTAVHVSLSSLFNCQITDTSKCQKFPQGQTVKPGPNQHLSQFLKFKVNQIQHRPALQPVVL